MTGILLLLSMALAGETLPSQAATDLGYSEPTITDDGWRAGLANGGLVKVIESANVETAKKHFAWQKQTAQAGVWPDVMLTGLPVDEIVGDGTVSLLVRKGTLVIYVRDLSDDARVQVERLLAKVQTDAD